MHLTRSVFTRIIQNIQTEKEKKKTLTGKYCVAVVDNISHLM